MTIIVVGGGSGGHITPNLVIAQALKAKKSDIRIVYISDSGSKLGSILDTNKWVDRHYRIHTGKFRRYKGHRLDLHSLFLNVRDIFRLIVGAVQALNILIKERPKSVFIKGGYVGVPVGLACALWRVSYITHDSDLTPGLANRFIGRWARLHATATPEAASHYEDGKSQVVGPIISPNFSPVTEAQRKAFRDELSIPEQASVVLVTGGGQGAERLNVAAMKISSELLDDESVVLLHLTGRAKNTMVMRHYESLGEGKKDRARAVDFVDNLHIYSGAADVVVSRAGATALAEFAAQSRACILVPNSLLGWDSQNAARLLNAGAVSVIEEEILLRKPDVLLDEIRVLLGDRSFRIGLGERLNSSIPSVGAVDELTKVLMEIR